MVLISDVFEENGHRVFFAIREYLTVKFRYLGDTNAGEHARLVELTHLCVRSAVFIFFSRYQEGLKVGVWHERYRECFCYSERKDFVVFEDENVDAD